MPFRYSCLIFLDYVGGCWDDSAKGAAKISGRLSKNSKLDIGLELEGTLPTQRAKQSGQGSDSSQLEDSLSDQKNIRIPDGFERGFSFQGDFFGLKHTCWPPCRCRIHVSWCPIHSKW